jgi:hypothetical protein
MASLCCSIDRCMSSVTLHMDLEPWQIGNGWQLATYCCWSASCRAALSNASEGRPACRGPDCWSRMTPTWPPLAAGMHWPPHSTPLPIPIVGEYSDGRTRRRPVRSRSLPGLARRRRLTATRSIRMCAAGRPWEVRQVRVSFGSHLHWQPSIHGGARGGSCQGARACMRAPGAAVLARVSETPFLAGPLSKFKWPGSSLLSLCCLY